MRPAPALSSSCQRLGARAFIYELRQKTKQAHFFAADFSNDIDNRGKAFLKSTEARQAIPMQALSSASHTKAAPQQPQPQCVYCDQAMRIFLIDHTQDPMAVFRCDGCGWEAMVPLQEELA